MRYGISLVALLLVLSVGAAPLNAQGRGNGHAKKAVPTATAKAKPVKAPKVEGDRAPKVKVDRAPKIKAEKAPNAKEACKDANHSRNAHNAGYANDADDAEGEEPSAGVPFAGASAARLHDPRRIAGIQELGAVCRRCSRVK